MAVKVVCQNKKAYHEYHIEQKIEAGMVLTGPEVKSLRAGRATLTDGYVNMNSRGEAFMYKVHISFYEFATHNPNEPIRPRKLLLHKREIRKLTGKLKEKGLALIPLKIYFIGNGKAKVELGLAKGKRQYDKRATLKKQQSDRELQRVMRHDR